VDNLWTRSRFTFRTDFGTAASDTKTSGLQVHQEREQCSEKGFQTRGLKPSSSCSVSASQLTSPSFCPCLTFPPTPSRRSLRLQPYQLRLRTSFIVAELLMRADALVHQLGSLSRTAWVNERMCTWITWESGPRDDNVGKALPQSLKTNHARISSSTSFLLMLLPSIRDRALEWAHCKQKPKATSNRLIRNSSALAYENKPPFYQE